MARLAYVARTLAGERVQGTLRAADERDLRDKLSLKGLEVLSVAEPAGGAEDLLDLSRFFAPVKMRTLTELTGQLALMLRTGSSLVDSLEALAEQTSEYRMAEILNAVASEVSSGSTLAAALQQHPRVFDGFYISAVQAGEASGTLTRIFERLEISLRKRMELRSSVTTALIYPIIVSTLAISAVTFVVTFVLPRFVTIFERGGVVLPLPTRILMGLSTFVVSYWYLLLAAAIGIPLAIYLYTKSEAGSKVVDRVLLRLPILGSVIELIQTTVLLRTLGTLLDSGVPLVESLGVARGACKNSLYQQLVENMLTGVTQGENLASKFSESELIAPAIKHMVRTGEQTGNLAMVLNTVSDHLDQDADKQMKRLSALFEPLIIIVMGGAIGFIAVSVLLPLFRLSSAAKGGG